MLLKGQGINIVDTSANVLHARYFSLAGASVTYFNGKDQVQVTPKYGGYDIRLTMDGSEIWKQVFDKLPERVYSPTRIQIFRNPGETFQAAADREYSSRQNCPRSSLLPTYVFKDRELGKTEIGPRGALPPARFLRGREAEAGEVILLP